MDIKGLPEGMLMSRFGVAGPDDFELVADPQGPYLRKGPRAGSSCQIIVTPADGYVFAPKYDIRSLEERFVVARKLAEPVSIGVAFVANNTYEQECIVKTVENLKLVPGYVGG